jgi:hypothetical protein
VQDSVFSGDILGNHYVSGGVLAYHYVVTPSEYSFPALPVPLVRETSPRSNGGMTEPDSQIPEKAALPMALYSAVKGKPRNVLLGRCKNGYTISEDFTEGKITTKKEITCNYGRDGGA